MPSNVHSSLAMSISCVGLPDKKQATGGSLGALKQPKLSLLIIHCRLYWVCASSTFLGSVRCPDAVSSAESSIIAIVRLRPHRQVIANGAAVQARLAEKKKQEQECQETSQRRLREMDKQQRSRAAASAGRALRSQSPPSGLSNGPPHDPAKARHLRNLMRAMPEVTCINMGSGENADGDDFQAILEELQEECEAGSDPLWGPGPTRWRGPERWDSGELAKDDEVTYYPHQPQAYICIYHTPSKDLG